MKAVPEVPGGLFESSCLNAAQSRCEPLLVRGALACDKDMLTDFEGVHIAVAVRMCNEDTVIPSKW